MIKAFVVLGPLGNLLTPQLISHSFRTYYLILLLFPFFYIRTKLLQMKGIVHAMPIFLYCFASLLWREGLEEEMPFLRLCLLLLQFLFVWGASFVVKKEDLLHLIRLYCKAFFISLILGYLFYLGYYLNLVPLPFLEFFSVLTQVGYGFLRLSPGSYPNEYGICCSFVLSLITWALLDKNISLFSRKWLLLRYFLLGIGLLLTTTRAAYLSYAFALIYLTWKTGHMKRVLFLSGAIFTSAITLLMVCGIDLFQVFSIGFDLANLESGSLADRLLEWQNGFELFSQQPFIGTGFASQTGLHSLYLQIGFELGILGLVMLLGALALYFFDRGYLRFRRHPEHELSTVVVLGWMHVLWFAASNHNLNHHLTWFILFLWLSWRNFALLKIDTKFLTTIN